MALRNIVQIGDPILRKKSRKVKKITDRIQILINDTDLPILFFLGQLLHYLLLCIRKNNKIRT